MRNLIYIGLLATAVLAIAVLAALPADAPDVAKLLQPPSTDHWLGTDRLGRDVGYRSLVAVGYTLSRSGFVLLLSLAVALPLAALSALRYNRDLDRIIVLTAEALRAFPTLLLVLLFAAIGLPATPLLVIYFWIPSWRLLRSLFVTQQRQPYVLNARLFGLSRLRVLLTEVFPNVTPRAVPYLGPLMAEILSVQAALEFLGFGPPIEQPSLGGLLLDAIQLGLAAPWTWLPSLFVIVVLVWGISALARAYQERRQWVPLT